MIARMTAKAKSGRRHWYAYDVVYDGEFIATDSHDPEHDAARVLLARGIIGTLTMLDAVTGKPRTVINIEKAARWRAEDGDTFLRRQKYRVPSAGELHSPEYDLVLPTQCQTALRKQRSELQQRPECRACEAFRAGALYGCSPSSYSHSFQGS
jgi:hypothetical protein